MDPGQSQGAGLPEAAQGQRHECPGRSEDHSAVEPGRRRLLRPAGPGGAEPTRKILMGFAAGEDQHLAPLVAGDLEGDVRRGAEAVEPETLSRGHAGQPEGAVADHAGAEQGRRLGVREGFGKPVGEVLVDDHELLIAAVGVEPGEANVFAEVFLSSPAVEALAARPVEPGNAHAVARSPSADAGAGGFHGAHDLVAGNDREFGKRELPFHRVEIGMAEPTGVDADQDLLVARDGHVQLAQRKGRLVDRRGVLQHHGSHRILLGRRENGTDAGGEMQNERVDRRTFRSGLHMPPPKKRTPRLIEYNRIS